MSDGNTVTVTTGTTPTNTVYTFNAATGNFTFTNKSTAIANGAAGLTFAKDQGLIPANGLRKVRTRTRAVPPFRSMWTPQASSRSVARLPICKAVEQIKS